MNGASVGVRVAMERLLERSGAAWRSVWTDQGGVRLHHVEAGSGRPIVLVHGGSGGGANWFRMLAALSQSGRVLAPDLPGFGLSERVEPHAPLGVAAADRLGKWLEQLQLQDVLAVGTSFGGLAALRLAQRGSGVTRLLLLGAAGLGRDVHPFVRLAAASPLTALTVRPTRRGTAELFRRLLTTERSGIPAAEQELLIDYLFASSQAAGTAYLTATLRLFCGAAGQREVLTAAELARLRLPVYVVWGERDRLLPVGQARRAAAMLPNARLLALPRIGHSPNWEQPAAVLDAVHRLAEMPLQDPLPERQPD